MADIREKDMPIGNPSLLRGLGEKGDSILVNVQSIQNFPFRGNLRNTDINSITTPGFYYLVDGNVNCPYGSYSYLLVINLVGDAIQFNMHNSGGIQYRKMYSRTWRGWVTIVSNG